MISRLLDTDTARKCLTTAQVRAQIKLSNAYLTRLLRDGVIEGFKLEGDWFVYGDSLENFLGKERRPGPRSAKNDIA